MNPQQIAQGQQQQQAGPVQPLNATELAQAFASEMQKLQQPMQQQQPQLTQEQIDQMLGTYNPDMSLVQALFGDDPERNQTRLEALQNMIRGVIANATGHGNVLVQDYLGRYHQQQAEALEDARWLAQQRFYDDLYKGNDGLRPYDAVIKNMIPQFEQMPNYPKSKADRASFVRDQVVALFKQTQPQFDPTKPVQAPPNAAQQSGGFPTFSGNAQQPPTLPSLAGGQQGAASPQGGAASAERPWDKVGMGF